ncbi:MAG: hypothetical protein AAF942_16710 [Pseudomonadota bacterium]
MARLAGLPAAVIERAESVLATLENGEQSGAIARLAEDLPLFAALARPAEAAAPAEPSDLEKTVDALDPDDLTAKEALDLVYRLKRLRRDDGA